MGTQIDGIELRDRVWLALVLPTDAGLYRRSGDRCSPRGRRMRAGRAGAVVRRLPGVAAAVFPDEPERSVYNNAVLARGPRCRRARRGGRRDGGGLRARRG